MDDGKIIIKAQIDSSGVDQDTRVLEGKVTKSANNLSGIIKGIGFAALAAKATQVAIKYAKEVNQATEAVSAKLKAASTLYQGVAVDQERLLRNLSDISADTGASLESLGQSVYDALSAGVKPTENMADVLKVVESSAKLAKGGFTDTATALSSTMKVINAYSMGIDNLDKVQGILIQTQNSGITTVDELGASLAQVVPTAASFGVSFENVGAAIAEMTKQGTKTAQATTSLNAIIAELGKNGTKASKSLEEAATAAGMTDTDFKSMLDSGMNLSEILQLMSDYAEANGLSMVDMFSSIEAGKGSLQLTGKAGKDFNEIMDSMQESAGLVQEAFEKTVDPSERLSASFNNLMVALGTKFKPVADSAKKTLADMFTEMTRNVTAGTSMERKYGDLEVALDKYKTFQEESAGKTDALTTSMKLQTKAALESALLDVSKEYSKSVKEIDKYTDSIDKAEKKQSELEASLAEIAEGTGKSVDELRTLMVDDEEAFFKVFADSFEASAAAVGNFVKKNDDLTKVEKELVEYRVKQSKAESDELQFINLLTQGYIEENEVTNTLLNAYPELKKRVLENVDAYKKLAEEKAKAANAGSDNDIPTINMNADETELEGELSNKAKLHNELIEAIAKTTEEYNNLDKASAETGKELYTQDQKLSALKSIYEEFIRKGVSPTSSAMQELWSNIEKLDTQIDKQIVLQESLSEEMNNVSEESERLKEAGELNGEALYSQEDHLKTLTSLYEKYIKAGIDPSSDAVKKLKEEIEKLVGTKKPLDDFGNALKDTFEKVANKVPQDTLKAFESLGEFAVKKKDMIADLDKQIEELEGETGRLAQAENELNAANIEEAVARERGDEKAIENAKAKVKAAVENKNALSDSLTILKKQRSSVEDNSEAWKSLGKASLESLAEVIQGLGSQLAAMAVSTYPNFGQMAASAAGSAAAFFAAGLIRAKAQKFATGGIVKGNSYTGDNIPVRVNAGELILNMAQQETLARILEASVALAELSASGGNGSGITVNMDGATIYGLDEPAVGKAIYDNIQNLRYEGVI